MSLAPLLPRSILLGTKATLSRAPFACPRTATTKTSASFCLRHLHASSILLAAKRSVRDAAHPSGIHYHLYPAPNPLSQSEASWGISLLHDPPVRADSAALIGWLRPTGGSNNDGAGEPEVGTDVERAVPNKRFFDVLHQAIKEECVPEDEFLEAEAQMRESGWTHIHDERAPQMPNRVPEPEDILASVNFVSSKIMPETYERVDTYRVVTKDFGLMQLPERWLRTIRRALERERVREESKEASSSS